MSRCKLTDLPLKLSRLMHLPPQQLNGDSHYYVSGNVTVHPGAAIAPGVLLQADPGSHLVLSAGVCVGSGAILHAHQGILEVEPGANVGSGVLLIGTGKVGSNACIGSMATLIDPLIEAEQMVAPGSLVGDASRHLAQLGVELLETVEPTAEEPSNPGDSPEVSKSEASQEAVVESSVPVSEEPPSPPAADYFGARPVYGKESINRLLSALLPHRQALQTPLDHSSGNGSS